MADTPPFKSADALTSERLIQLYTLWKNLAARRIGPKRTEITPANIRGLLPWTWIFDVVNKGADFRFRFAGEQAVEFMGQRFAGRLLSEFRSIMFFERFHLFLAECVRRKAPVALGPVPSIYEGKEFLELEGLLLPLSEDDHSISSLFGGFQTWPLGTHLRVPGSPA